MMLWLHICISNLKFIYYMTGAMTVDCLMCQICGHLDIIMIVGRGIVKNIVG